MDELIRKQDALDAIHCDITVTGRQNAELVAATIGVFADRIKALPPVQLGTNLAEVGTDLVSKRAAIDALTTYIYNVYKVVVGKTLPAEDCGDAAESVLDELPTVQPDEKLERCRFEYIHACKIVSIPTPDVTEKDKQDAYAVIKALQPIFGDTPFAKVKRGETDAETN